MRVDLAPMRVLRHCEPIIIKFRRAFFLPGPYQTSPSGRASTPDPDVSAADHRSQKTCTLMALSLLWSFELPQCCSSRSLYPDKFIVFKRVNQILLQVFNHLISIRFSYFHPFRFRDDEKRCDVIFPPATGTDDKAMTWR